MTSTPPDPHGEGRQPVAAVVPPPSTPTSDVLESDRQSPVNQWIRIRDTTVSALFRGKARKVRARRGALWIFGALVLLIVFFSITTQGFLSRLNFLATTQYASEYIPLAVGQTFVIVSGGIDLSDGAVLGFAPMIGADVMSHMAGHASSTVVSAIGIIVVLMVGIGVGMLNGLLITRLQLLPFIATLATLGALGGAADLINNGQSIINFPGWFSTMGSTNVVGWFNVPFLVALAAAVIFGVILARTQFGLRTYGLGSNPEGARRAGVHVRRHLMKVYILSGFLAALAGLLVMARFGEANPTSGTNDELDAIAAVVIGGASLYGGTGSMFGSMVGTAIVSILVTGLILLGVVPFWQPIAVGIVIVLAVTFDSRVRARLVQGGGERAPWFAGGTRDT